MVDIKKLQPMDIFGERELMEGTLRVCRSLAETDVTCLVLEKE